ncbi:type II toxin-antitoxin system mRNA interferase toxin, RelE/StbE family [Candidatus Azambacteria bacterium]|nr:type II toxin-antitoxin system mRNA interferase toxin, RelE/StbE family [Candidatus Azambacteria bacterium]
MALYFTPYFKRSFKRLSKHIQQIAWERLQVLENNPFHQSLHTHKLSHGELWSARVDYKNRIIFIFLKNEQGILLINIGVHSMYRNQQYNGGLKELKGSLIDLIPD